MGKTELKLVKSLGKKQVDNKDLLLAVRAKAFELQTVLSDLQEFGKNLNTDDKFKVNMWVDDTNNIYQQSGEMIKGA